MVSSEKIKNHRMRRLTLSLLWLVSSRKVKNLRAQSVPIIKWTFTHFEGELEPFVDKQRMLYDINVISRNYYPQNNSTEKIFCSGQQIVPSKSNKDVNTVELLICNVWKAVGTQTSLLKNFDLVKKIVPMFQFWASVAFLIL